MRVIKIGIAHGVVASIATMSIMACLGTTEVKKPAAPKVNAPIGVHAKAHPATATTIHAAN